MIFKTSVVFPEASGPKISVTRPLGIPPIPRAISKPKEPVEIAATLPAWEAICSPSFIIEPRPKDFSICSMALSSALDLPVFSADFFSAIAFDINHSRGKKQEKLDLQGLEKRGAEFAFS